MQAVAELLVNVEFAHSTFCPSVTDVVVEMSVPTRLRVTSRTWLESIQSLKLFAR